MADRISTKSEIRSNVLETTNQEQSQIGSLVDEFINLTLNEIADPSWCYSPRNPVSHRWSWLRRKTTISTVAAQEEYILARDIDYIASVRRPVYPYKITRMLEDDLEQLHSNPSTQGAPLIYTDWETIGSQVSLTSADTIKVVSSDADDANDSDLYITIWGKVSGVPVIETVVLTGTSTATSTNTFDAGQIFISKSKDTEGTITITKTTGGATLLILTAQERGAYFKVISFYPIPSSVETITIRYYEGIRPMINDGDVPHLPTRWHHIVRIGTLAKVYQHLGKEEMALSTQKMYKDAVLSMITADSGKTDLIRHLKRHNPLRNTKGQVTKSSDDIT